MPRTRRDGDPAARAALERCGEPRLHGEERLLRPRPERRDPGLGLELGERLQLHGWHHGHRRSRPVSSRDEVVPERRELALERVGGGAIRSTRISTCRPRTRRPRGRRPPSYRSPWPDRRQPRRSRAARPGGGRAGSRRRAAARLSSVAKPGAGSLMLESTQPGADVVDRDPVGGPLARHHADEQADRVLRGAVDAERAEGHDGVHRGGDDDRAAVALAPHQRGSGAAAVEDAVEVHAEDGSQSSRVTSTSVCHRATPAFATNDVEPAEPLGCSRRRVARFHPGRNVAAQEDRAATERLDLGHPPRGLVLVPTVCDRDVEAMLCERERDPATDPAVAGSAGDERDGH